MELDLNDGFDRQMGEQIVGRDHIPLGAGQLRSIANKLFIYFILIEVSSRYMLLEPVCGVLYHLCLPVRSSEGMICSLNKELFPRLSSLLV